MHPSPLLLSEFFSRSTPFTHKGPDLTTTPQTRWKRHRNVFTHRPGVWESESMLSAGWVPVEASLSELADSSLLAVASLASLFSVLRDYL